MLINCENSLTITGSVEKITEFQERFMTFTDTEPCIRFEQIKPSPIFINNQDVQQWRRQNWGCPDDIHGAGYHIENDNITIDFETLEFPPVELIETLAAQMPELDFELYFEAEDNRYGGYSLFMDGILHEHAFLTMQNNQNEEDEELKQVEQTTIQVQSLFQPPNLTGFHTCPICIKDAEFLLENVNDLVALTCDARHVYCLSCIQGYFESQDNIHKCPLCSTLLVVI